MHLKQGLIVVLAFSTLSFPASGQGDQEKIDHAQSVYEKAVTADPQNKEAYFMLGLIYESKRQDADALRVWKKYLSLEADPEKKQVAEKHIHRLSQ